MVQPDNRLTFGKIIYKMQKLKIATFWDYDKDNPDVWGTPTGIYRNIKKLGYEIDRYPLPASDKTLGFKMYLEQEKKYDICLLFNAGSLREGTPYWSKEKLGDVLLVQEAGDEPQAFQSHAEIAAHSDLVLTTDLRCYWAYKARNINGYWFNSWCDREIFYPTDTVPDLDVVTSMYGTRGHEPQIMSALGNRYVKKTGLQGKENGEFFGRGKIIFQQSRHGEVTRRLFEGMGCRKLIFTDYLHPDTGIYELFRQRQDLIYYGNAEEAIHWMNYYLEHEEEREEIANNGYNKVIKYHTAQKRTEKLLELIEDLINEKN